MQGDIARRLLAKGKLDPQGIERATALRAASGERLDRILTRLGLVTERDMAHALAEDLGLPLCGPTDFPDRPVLGERVAARFLRASRVLPLAETADGVELAMADPLDSYSADAIQLLAGKPVKRRVAIPGELDQALDRLYGAARHADEAARALAPKEQVAQGDVERLRDLASDAPVIRLLNGLIARASEERASDIHVEPFEGRLSIRFRIDGVLKPVEAPPLSLEPAIASRVKVMAGLDIAERRLPQDGRIKANVAGRDIDIRVSCVPTQAGESIVLRLLDKERAPLDLDRLGFSPHIRAGLAGLLERPNGIILVTGPTGSGKSTTLYAGLQRLNDPGRKLITVEDPVEYQLTGINQIQVRPRIGLTFAHVLRAILRQDPDIVMVGEIRDGETARIAVQAALTGHLVLSTLHTNDAPGAISRLLDMGVEDYLLTSALLGTMAQRLVRTICPHCKESWQPLPAFVRETGLDRVAGTDAPTLWRGRGCESCRGAGYAGRTTIAELLPMDERISALVLSRADRPTIAAEARAAGMIGMAEDGFRKALGGETTVEEVLRVTQMV